MIQAVAVVARLTPAKSARGASSGMASVAWPELEGIKKARGMLSTTVTTANPPAEAALVAALEAAASVEVTPDQLTILDRQGRIAMEAVRPH
jgi:hypothetical protein